MTIDLDAAGVERCLAEAGIGVHVRAGLPSRRRATPRPVRGELRVPTVFNFLGPLTNPARPVAQVVGVSDARMLPLMAEVLARRGVAREAVPRRGRPRRAHHDRPVHRVRRPRRGGAGAPPRSGATSASRGRRPTTCAVATPRESAAIARSILAGEPGPRRDVVLLNAGAALEVAGAAGVDRGGDASSPPRSIDDGAAAATLERWVAVSQAAGMTG